jgi:hypothetical protein
LPVWQWEAAITVVRESSMWLPLPLAGWRATKDTLHMWTQVVGKIVLANTPHVNHWWAIALHVTPRGLTTGSVTHGKRTFQIEFDLHDHRLRVQTSDGATAELPLEPGPVAEFYSELMGTLRALGLATPIRTTPVEVENPIPFEADYTHAVYDREQATRFAGVLVQVDRVMREFRGRFIGKASPVHFFWGSFDMAVTRFSGRPAPPHPGGIPNMPDSVAREGYSHELHSAGWWPGAGAIEEPMFYAYAYPEPAGFSDCRVRPSDAYYHQDLREFVLPYDAVRAASDPDGALLEFLQSTYEAAAELQRWDRALLER